MKKVFAVLFFVFLFAFVMPAHTNALLTTQGNTVTTKVGNPPVAPHPTPPVPEPDDLQAAIKQQFNITMKGFDKQHLEWAWDKFWDISGTKFFSLNVRGTDISAYPADAQKSFTYGPCVHDADGMSLIHMDLAQWDHDNFVHALIHEFGHVIYFCNDTSVSEYPQSVKAFTEEGPVSAYYQLSFTDPTEDYAENISYYLNRDLPLFGDRFAQATHPLHYKIAHDIVGDYE